MQCTDGTLDRADDAGLARGPSDHGLLFVGLLLILVCVDASLYPIPFWPFNTGLFTY